LELLLVRQPSILSEPFTESSKPEKTAPMGVVAHRAVWKKRIPNRLMGFKMVAANRKNDF
jgi:hypothetical protein